MLSDRRSRWTTLVLVCASLIALACNLSSLVPFSPAKSPEILPDDLWAATLSPTEVKALLSDHWWPNFPQFNVGFDADPAGHLAGEQFFVAQSYDQVGELAQSRLETSLVLFENDQLASAALARLKATRDQGSQATTGPQIGDESRYFTRKTDDQVAPFETTARFRVGRVLTRISLFNQLGYEQPQALARYSEPVVQKLGQLLAGQLHAPAVPSSLANALPPSSAAPGIVLGTAVIPIESWALADLSQKPEAMRQKLAQLGASQLVLRRYALPSDKTQVVEIVLFPFADEQSAVTWVKDFIKTARNHRTLDVGKTGQNSAFTDNDGDNYELQFAKGRYVADVSCFGPFDSASAACEVPVRRLAEQWFSVLK